LSSIELEKRADCGQTSDFFLEERRFMERRLLPAWVLVARRNPNPQASLRISLLDEERLLQLSQPGVSHLAQPVASFLAFALFMGISMSITAFPVLVRILQDRGIFKTSLGSTATACAAVDDVTAWSMLAFVVAIARATPALAGVLRFHRSAHPNRPPQQRSELVDLLGRYRGSH